jgi:hypothetical protein
VRTLQLYDNLALPALRTSAPCTFATMYPARTRFRDHSALQSCMDRRTQAQHSAVHTLPVVDERLQCRSAHTYCQLMRHSPFDTPRAPWLMAFAAAEELAPAAVTLEGTADNLPPAAVRRDRHIRRPQTRVTTPVPHAEPVVISSKTLRQVSDSELAEFLVHHSYNITLPDTWYPAYAPNTWTV